MWYLDKFLRQSHITCLHWYLVRFWLRTLVYRPESGRAPDLHFALGDSRHGHYVQAWGLSCVRTPKSASGQSHFKMVDLQLCERDADSAPMPYVHARGFLWYAACACSTSVTTTVDCHRSSASIFGLCGRCRNSRYCSRACRRHWRAHKHCCDRHANKQLFGCCKAPCNRI